jgi:DNA-binding response OmpR family regulator
MLGDPDHNEGVSTPRALIIEDVDEFVLVATAVLESEGFEVFACGTAADGIAEVRRLDPDLVILDITLPDGLGFEVCRVIRTFSDPYVVIVSGRQDEIDKVLGFEVGADDYLTKPFSARELGARVAAMRRRPRAPRASHLRTFGDVVVDTRSREVTLSDQPVELTRIEFDLLDVLTANPRRALSREELIEQVWGGSWFGDTHVVDVHIANLRKKIGESGRAPKHLKTVRDVGFRFDPS